jgi:hypothetical protein
MGTSEFAKSRDERKKVETRFAHLKTQYVLVFSTKTLSDEP